MRRAISPGRPPPITSIVDEILGISGVDDALEFMLAGSSAVQIGTANFFNPKGCPAIVDAMEAWCRKEGIGAVRELIGALQLPSGAPADPTG